MAKINIPFNDKNYSVDESSLSAASAALKSHLSNVMNGSGATINLGGVSYNVDSAKLSTATNALITHLGTIAGNGKKVVVSGVEYNIGSDKVAGAVSELEIVLGGLHSDDGGSQMPEKNEYGFYYNVPYITENDYGQWALVFCENSSMYSFTTEKYSDIYELLGDYSCNYTYNSLDNTIIDEYEELVLVVGEDGKSLSGDFGVFVADMNIVHCDGIHYYELYVSEDSMYDARFYEDGSVKLTYDGINSETLMIDQWNSPYNGYLNARGDSFRCSIDGETLYIWNYYGENVVIKYHHTTFDDK